MNRILVNRSLNSLRVCLNAEFSTWPLGNLQFSWIWEWHIWDGDSGLLTSVWEIRYTPIGLWDRESWASRCVGRYSLSGTILLRSNSYDIKLVEFVWNIRICCIWLQCGSRLKVVPFFMVATIFPCLAGVSHPYICKLCLSLSLLGTFVIRINKN